MILRWIAYIVGFLIGPFVGGVLLTLVDGDTAYVLYALFFAMALLGSVIFIFYKMGFFSL